MPIPCPHFKITIVKRSQGQSAVAGAAYQSGERLFSEYDQRTKFYNKKKELVHAEIMLPSHAPPGYADRATLWNAVEAVENQWNSQLARRIVLAFPVEVPKEQYLPMLKEFCQEQFVSKGMIADFAIHDKGDGNPHAHILLTLRAMDEHGRWLPKARKVYNLDENGERIQLPSGNWKCHKENTVDWNDQKYARYGGTAGKLLPIAILKPLADRNVLTSAHSSVRECSRYRLCISAPLLTRWKSEESKPFLEISTGIFALPTA